MRRHFMLGTVFSAALAVGAYAQSAGQSPTGQQDASKGSSSAQTVTVTGCLKADSAAGSPGAPASPGASSAAAGYILTDVSPSAGGSNPASPTESPSPSPTATSGTSSATYKLTGSTSDFASLVGKKVEVKGSVRPSGAGNAPESRPGSAMGDPSKAPQLRVSSVKEVSGSC